MKSKFLALLGYHIFLTIYGAPSARGAPLQCIFVIERTLPSFNFFFHNDEARNIFS